jgi:hypothetical protein
MPRCAQIHAQKSTPGDLVIDMLPPPLTPWMSGLEACKCGLGVKVLHVAACCHPHHPLPRPILHATLGVATPTPLLLRCQQCVRGWVMRNCSRKGGGERKGSINDCSKDDKDGDELDSGGGNAANGKEGTPLKRKG